LLDQECAPEQRELVETINNAGEHLLTLLNDMLDLAKMSRGGWSWRRPVRDADLVKGFGHQARGGAEEGLSLTRTSTGSWRIVT